MMKYFSKLIHNEHFRFSETKFYRTGARRSQTGTPQLVEGGTPMGPVGISTPNFYGAVHYFSEKKS